MIGNETGERLHDAVLQNSERGRNDPIDSFSLQPSTHPNSAHSTSPQTILPYPTLSYPILSHPIPFHPILRYLSFASALCIYPVRHRPELNGMVDGSKEIVRVVCRKWIIRNGQDNSLGSVSFDVNDYVSPGDLLSNEMIYKFQFYFSVSTFYPLFFIPRHHLHHQHVLLFLTFRSGVIDLLSALASRKDCVVCLIFFFFFFCFLFRFSFFFVFFSLLCFVQKVFLLVFVSCVYKRLNVIRDL